jgi:hypothetical protein
MEYLLGRTMKILNLTPHTVNVCDADGRAVLTLPPSGQVARVSQKLTPVAFSPAPGVVCYAERTGEITGLPDAEPATALVVSAMVRTAAPHRRDLLSPGELIRDAAGQPIGCRGLIGNWGRD